MSKLYLLIDADVLAYRAASGAEKVIEFDGTCLPVCDLADALAAFEYQLSRILNVLKPDDFALCFSTDRNGGFRREVYPNYKMNREGKPRPVALKPLRATLIDNVDNKYTIYIREGLEADDCMGILATQKSFKPKHRKVIVSIDKDMKTVPGWFYNIKDLSRYSARVDAEQITPEDADRFFLKQTLIGDAADGYPGCPKIGPMTATKIMADCEPTIAAMWPLVVAAYEKAGLTEDDALIQARVARILRAEDYNFKEKKVKLWTPTK